MLRAAPSIARSYNTSLRDLAVAPRPPNVGIKIVPEKGAVIVAVHEDWASDGAGNGLGTLYAYAKARAQAMARVDGAVDLDAMLGSPRPVMRMTLDGMRDRWKDHPGYFEHLGLDAAVRASAQEHLRFAQP